MSSMSELNQEANRLRQEKKFTEALPIYEKLWTETGDKYDGAGLVNCLRNLKDYDKAIPLAEELIIKFPDFQWGRHESIWTLIGGRLNKLDDNTPFENVLKVASDIMQLKPEDLAAKMVVFRVLKAAKAKGDWDTVFKWTGLLDTTKLSTTPMTDENGREGWCDQSLWYNYKIKASIEKGQSEDILQFIDKIIETFPKQKNIFYDLKRWLFIN